MKYKVALLFLSFFFIGIAQKNKDLVIYVDSTHSFCKEKEHQYIRVIKDYYLDKESYVFAEYYKSGKIALKGETKDKNSMRFIGTVISYYENGNKKEISNYLNFSLNGKQFGWYENGTTEFEKDYNLDMKSKIIVEKIHQHWDENGNQDVINGNGFYTKATETKIDYLNPNTTFSESGEIKNGLRNGIWTGKSKELKISFTEIYNEGKFVNGVSTDWDNLEHPYTEVFKKPIPKIGMDNFYKYIGQHFIVPRVTPSYERPLSANLNGKILISFTIDKNGKIIDSKIIHDIGYGSGDEALRVIKKSEDWIPGEIRGVKTKVFYRLPITIKS